MVRGNFKSNVAAWDLPPNSPTPTPSFPFALRRRKWQKVVMYEQNQESEKSRVGRRPRPV